MLIERPPHHPDRFTLSNSAHEYLVPGVFRELERAHCAGGRLVELGCGNGEAAELLAARGFEVTAFDDSEETVSRARTRRTSVRFEVGSLDDPTLSRKMGKGFAVATSLNVIPHLLAPKRLFERAHELLEPNGLLLVGTHYNGYLKNLAIALAGRWDHHFGVFNDERQLKFFSRSTLIAMAGAAGFRTLAVRGLGRTPYLWKSMLLVARRVP